MTKMTNEQFKSLKKVVKLSQPNLDYAGKSFINSILKQMNVEVLNYVLHEGLYISLVLTDLSVISVMEDKKRETKIYWTNKPRLGKLVKPEPMYKVACLSKPVSEWSEEGLMLVDYLAKGYNLEDVREVKILNNPDYEPDQFSNKVFKTRLEKHLTESSYFLMVDISPTAFNQNEILVIDWQSDLPSTDAGQSKDCGQENKFIPLTEWLQTKAPHTVSKARVKGTRILSEAIHLLTNDKVYLDDRTTKYHINQIEVK